MRHTIQALVENKFGVLARVASLFSARGYNIESLAVGETEKEGVSCMTIVVNAADEKVLEQIKKQLHKLIDTIAVVDFTHKEYIDRELILVKVATQAGLEALERNTRDCIVKIVEKKAQEAILLICADRHTLDEIVKELKAVEIKELVRTGKIALGK